MVINTRLFTGKEYNLQVYNQQALINYAIRFFSVLDCPPEIPYEEFPFDFPDYVSSYMRVYNERDGRLLKNYILSRDQEYLIINEDVPAMTFDSLGNYWYEIGYVRAVYDQVLRYGTLNVL